MEMFRLMFVSVRSNLFKLSVRLSSHLVEFELKAKDVAEGEWLTHVGFDERQKELILVRSTLIHLQDDIQNPVWIQVKTSYRQKSKRNEQPGKQTNNQTAEEWGNTVLVL